MLPIAINQHKTFPSPLSQSVCVFHSNEKLPTHTNCEGMVEGEEENRKQNCFPRLVLPAFLKCRLLEVAFKKSTFYLISHQISCRLWWWWWCSIVFPQNQHSQRPLFVKSSSAGKLPCPLPGMHTSWKRQKANAFIIPAKKTREAKRTRERRREAIGIK